MPHEGFLLTLAQVGVGVAGFASLLTVLRSESGAGWTARELSGVQFMLLHALALVFFALLPFTVAPFITAADDLSARALETVWRVCSGVLCAFLLADLAIWIAVFNRARQRAFGARGQHRFAPDAMNQVASSPTLLVYMFFVPTAVAAGAEAWNAMRGGFAVFELGLVSLLFHACVQLWVFISLYSRQALARNTSGR